jgi:hypothetical protein
MRYFSFTESQNMSNENIRNFTDLCTFTSAGSSRVFKGRNAGRTPKDLQPNRDLPHSFQNRPRTYAAANLNVVQRHVILLPAGKRTHPSTSQRIHWRCFVATGSTYSGIREFCPYYSRYFHSCHEFLCSLHLSGRKYRPGTPDKLSTHHL